MSDQDKMSQCCTCGFKWRTGQDGSHHCSEFLLIKMTAIKEKLKECRQKNPISKSLKELDVLVNGQSLIRFKPQERNEMSFNFTIKPYDVKEPTAPFCVYDRLGTFIISIKASQNNDEFIEMFDAFFERGKKLGREEAQEEIREKLGL